MQKFLIRRKILLLAVAAFFLLGTAQPLFAAFPTDWSYRKSHVINSAAGAGTDSGENVYLDGNCQADFGDVRFVSSDGVTELDYWMETGSLDPGVSAVFWVKVADDLGAANQTIYIYYGNTTGTVTTTSNGDNTFIFFDDFDGDLSTKWTVEKTLDGGFIAIQPGDFLRCGGGQTGGTFGHTSLGSSPAYDNFTDGAIEVRLKQSVNALGEIAYRGNYVPNAGTGYKGRFDCRTGNETPHMRPPYYNWAGFGTAVTRFGSGTNTWYRGSVTVTSSGGSYTHRIFKNDALMSTTTDTTYAGDGEIALQNHYGSFSDYDWVAVRNFVYPEPAHDAWGAESSLQADVSATKSVALSKDADGNGVITPGDTMQYNVKIYNTGNVVALGTELTDNLPAETTYTGSWTATNGTVTHNAGQISWTGSVTADPTGVIKTEITFDVTVNSGTSISTVVSNQGTVSYDSDNDGTNGPAADILTDGDPYTAGIQTTDFTVGGSAQATGTKTAALAVDADGNGVITPGDTLEYTIVITNMTGFVPIAAIEITDVIPPNTTYDDTFTPTVTDYEVTPGVPNPLNTDHTIEIFPPLPTGRYPEELVIKGIDIGPVADSPDNIVEIKFRVILDDPMAAGVTQISNQAVGFYDSDSDGTNDTYQGTDGDPGTLGNQPTVSDIYIGTISGTVFDDNGTGTGGIDGDGNQNGAEPGISDVTVTLYDYLIDSFYFYGDTITDSDGNFIFTELAPGDYDVRETDPDYYVSTTPNDVSVTLEDSPSTGDSEVVNYGDQVNGNADLEVVKHCTTVTPDGTNQLVFVITVTNDGPDPATNVALTDDLTSLISAGLSNIEYTLDGGARNSWTSPLTLGDMATYPDPSYSHTVRIYADVSETFSPTENTATVVSDIFDPATGDNTSSCTNQPCPGARRAMQFNPATNASVTVASAPSLQLTTSGTVEAWINVDEFQANSELISKGNTAETFNIGLCGGDSGDKFSGGTAQNIGFALYDTGDNQHLFIADDTLAARQWYHIACVWDLNASPQVLIYINGIEAAITTSSTGVSDVQATTEDLVIGFNQLTGGSFTGTMDEVRIWDEARTQARIRDTMCHKITDAESDYLDLVGNWRFDEQCGVVCNDASAYGNIGITNAERVCSEAPIGDDSAYDYNGSGAGGSFQVLNFASNLADNITVTEDGGDWDPSLDSCLHAYRVDIPPESVGQPLFWKSLGLAPHYWGVFKSGGTDPTYKVVYTYTGYPYTNEETFNLAFRNHNCESWKSANADQDKVNDLLTRAGFSGTEFILGQDVDPRNAIDFDGTDDYIEVSDTVTNGDLDLTTTGTIEAWVNISTHQANAGIIHKGDGTNDSYSLYMSGASNDQVYFTVDDGSTPNTINSTTTLKAGTWYHVAGTWNDGADTMTLYINGVQETTGSTVTAQETDNNLFIGVNQTGPNYFNGKIDEVRIWDVARNQDAIRDTMCKKVTSSDTGWSNLVGYWRFDEETNSVNCPDASGNGNDGTMTNFGTDGSTDILAARVCSSAPIGDDSAWDYYDGGPGTVSTQLAHLDGDYIFATENSGPWTEDFSGLQIYRVDEAPVYPPDIGTNPYPSAPSDPYPRSPNGLTPPIDPNNDLDFDDNWSSIDYSRYWGVFATDWGTAPPSYDVMYYYTGNPNVPDKADPSDPEAPQIGLAERPDYCFATWSDSGANWAFGTGRLELFNQDQNTPKKTNPEYVLGGKNQPLAISLISFTADPDADRECIDIAWETATEVETIGYYLWRSTSRDGEYERIEDSFVSAKSIDSTQGAKYAYRDCDIYLGDDMNYFYKLEEVDMDNTRDNPFYGPIGPVSEHGSADQVTSARNRSNSSGSSSTCFISILK
ncbi:MAG: DUF2341 domain-containing protein [Desulfobacterales bacterium]|nr:DUF2341 domain-containing protein [Desulfobacterales bacterium]